MSITLHYIHWVLDARETAIPERTRPHSDRWGVGRRLKKASRGAAGCAVARGEGGVKTAKNGVLLGGVSGCQKMPKNGVFGPKKGENRSFLTISGKNFFKNRIFRLA
jgi:hypothetical protein